MTAKCYEPISTKTLQIVLFYSKQGMSGFGNEYYLHNFAATVELYEEEVNNKEREIL